MSESLTIGLPCRNSILTLADTLRSVFAQTRQDWELIVVDDGSTDGTVEYLQKIHDSRMHLIVDGEHRGLAARLNQIAGEARGEWLFRMDADDLMFPQRLEKQMAFLRAHPELTLCGTAIVCINTCNCPVSRRCPPEFAQSANRILAGEVLYHPTVAGRTEWFRKHPYDETWGRSQDFELWARTSDHLRIGNLSEPLLFYREAGATPWAKYAEHSRNTCRALRRHGPEKIGRARTAMLVGRRRLKDSVYAGLRLLGLWERAVALRNQPLTPEERATFQKILRDMLQRDGGECALNPTTK